MRTESGFRGRLRAAVAAALAALALVLPAATLDGTRAAFSATTTNAGDELATGQLQAPSGLTVTQSCAPSPAVTRRTATGASGTTSVTLPLPSGTTAGDLLMAQVVHRSGAQTIGAPAGWTPQMSTSNGSQITSAVYWKVAVAGETAPVFSRPSWASGVMAGGLNAYIGVRASAPVAAYGDRTGTGTTASTPTLTTTATTVEVVHLLTKVQEALPAPAGTTLMITGTAGISPDSLGVVAADDTFTGPGTTVSRSATSTSSTSSEWIAQTLVLQRVRDIPSASLSWAASPSSWAGGYELTRRLGGTVQRTQQVTGVGTTSATDGPLTNGTSYTFGLSTAQGTWRSSAVTAGSTPNCP
jgi:hypothetical protein